MSKQKQRDIDRMAQGSYSWIKEKIVLLHKTHVKTWHGVAFFAFLVGVAVSIFWMANFDAGVSTRAGNSQSLSDSDVTAEVAKINSAIKEKKAKWKAGETSMNRLDPEERKKRLGLNKEDFQNYVSTLPQAASGETALATTLDWRSQGYVTPIKNQGSCGSCWAFAATANAESANLIKNQNTFSQNPIDLSEQVVVSCSGAGTCSGGSSYSAGAFYVSTGSPVESCYPYTATNGNCSSACAGWQDSTSKISNQVSVSANVDQLKNALNSYGPLVTAFAVYSDFFSYRSGVYSYTSGTLQGYHAVQIVGYDDTNQSFIVKNSWGSGWGESGFFHIAYSEVGGMSNFAYSSYAYNTNSPINPPEADTTNPSVSISSPTNNATVSGSVSVNATASDNVGVTKVEFYRGSTLSYTDNSSPYNFNWSTITVPNGPYVLFAKAYDASGNIGTSSNVTVNVNNIADNQNPIITINNPANGTVLPAKGTVAVSTSATDDVGVTKIEILLDNKIKTSCTQQTCTYNLNATSLKKGSHTISAKAYDASGKMGTSSIIVTK